MVVVSLAMIALRRSMFARYFAPARPPRKDTSGGPSGEGGMSRLAASSRTKGKQYPRRHADHAIPSGAELDLRGPAGCGVGRADRAGGVAHLVARGQTRGDSRAGRCNRDRNLAPLHLAHGAALR